jgi:hypothetical protein
MTAESVKHKTITVTIRTPAGHPHEFTFELSVRVGEVIDVAVAYFVAAGQLATGNYGLAVIRHGRAEDMADGARLEDYGIDSREVLALTVKGPQVDGLVAVAA